MYTVYIIIYIITYMCDQVCVCGLLSMSYITGMYPQLDDAAVQKMGSFHRHLDVRRVV